MFKMKTLSIKQRLFLIMFFFIGLPVFVLGAVWYENSTTRIEQSAIDSHQRLIRQTNEYLDLYMSNLENATYPFATHPHIQQLIHEKAPTPYRFFQLSETIEDDLFAQMTNGRPDIVGISVVTENNVQITDYSRVKEWIDMERIRRRNEQFIKQMDRFAPFHVTGHQKVGSMPVLNVVRKINNNETYLYEALLVIDIDLKQIAEISQNVSDGNGNVWIMDLNGQIIYHSDPQRLGKSVSPKRLERFLSRNRDVFRDDVGRNEEIILYEHSRVTDWIVVAELPLKKIIGNLMHLRNMTLISAAAVFAIAFAVLAGFSFSLTRSLSLLQKLMKKVESGDFTVRLTTVTDRQDEIGTVFKSFCNMVRELNRLVKEVHQARLKEQAMEIKQKDSALQAMQSQINPHFLYNTLEIINSHAIMDQNRKISKMTRALAHLFRYNIGNAKQTVSLREEMAHIRSYLEIQSERYRKLEVDLNVEDDDTDEVCTLRMTLQPLVENAFLHGYQNHKIKPSYIGIFGEKRDAWYSLRIKDRGKGMSPAVMERYNAAFRHSRAERAQPFKSIGMLNVHERIRLAFGEPYGLRIWHSGAEEGTLIELKLPYRHSLEEGEHVSRHDRR